MSYIDDILSRLFPRKNRHASVVHEVIRRSEDYMGRYREWVDTGAGLWMQEMGKAYYYKQAGIGHQLEVHLLHSPYANGFAVFFQEEVARQQARFILDQLRDRVLNSGYRLAQSDRRVTERDNKVKEVEKHYLKPPLSNQSDDIDQLYGNVAIELIFVNNRADHLKLTASVYSDRLYKEAKPFDELASALFDKPDAA
ncbi:hypothetical protein AB9P05_13985 [Roseivirga sp. BDSF3-8]|uniref:hypothetical protein n=1 Tax=Roseivirga sp. BDSF3-8 TaxID=3241598 RepID=UPI0035319B6F